MLPPDPLAESEQRAAPSLSRQRDPWTGRISGFPWWLLAIILVLAWGVYFVSTTEDYREAFDFILRGISITVETTVYAYGFALVIGLVMGLGRVSRNLVFRNIARFYVEVVRGIPILVLIFFVAFVASVDVAAALGMDARDI